MYKCELPNSGRSLNHGPRAAHKGPPRVRHCAWHVGIDLVIHNAPGPLRASYDMLVSAHFPLAPGHRHRATATGPPGHRATGPRVCDYRARVCETSHTRYEQHGPRIKGQGPGARLLEARLLEARLLEARLLEARLLEAQKKGPHVAGLKAKRESSRGRAGPLECTRCGPVHNNRHAGLRGPARGPIARATRAAGAACIIFSAGRAH